MAKSSDIVNSELKEFIKLITNYYNSICSNIVWFLRWRKGWWIQWYWCCCVFWWFWKRLLWSYEKAVQVKKTDRHWYRTITVQKAGLFWTWRSRFFEWNNIKGKDYLQGRKNIHLTQEYNQCLIKILKMVWLNI